MSSPDPIAATFELAWTRAELPSNAPVDSTLHRRLKSLPSAGDRLPALRVGTEDGPDLVEGELLGEGGMGQVHAARDGVLERTVAVKRPRAEAGARAAGAIVAEARVLAGLDHPNIVPVHALGRDELGAPVLVMKRITGQRWSSLARQGPDLDRDLRIFLDVADALRFAHARGLLHRDLKPDNVMVGGFGEVYLMDWGCACPAQDALTVEIVGTPCCMAPEMLALGARIGPATDVFLLGAMLHQVWTGQPRHAGANLREVLQAAWAVAPLAYGPEVPAALARILNRACARAPEDRYPSVEDMAQAVRAFQVHRAAELLAAQALALLPELEAAIAAGSSRAEVLFAECRFGARAALEAWPECGTAHECLRQARAAWLPWKLGQGELGAVEALLPELEPEEAGPWAERLRQARRERAQREDALQAHDLGVAARERRNSVLALSTAAILVMGAVALVTPAQGIGPGELVLLGIGGVGLVVLSILPFRDRILRTQASRSMMLGLVLTLVGSLLHRVLAWAGDAQVVDILRGDCLIMAVGLGTVALSYEWALVLAALPYLVAALAILAWPARAVDLYPLAVVASLLFGLGVFARRARGVEEG